MKLNAKTRAQVRRSIGIVLQLHRDEVTAGNKVAARFALVRVTRMINNLNGKRWVV